MAVAVTGLGPGGRARAQAAPDSAGLLVLRDGADPLLDATAQSVVDEAGALFGELDVRSQAGDFRLEGLTRTLVAALEAGTPRGIVALGPLSTAVVAASDEARAIPTVSLLGAPLEAHGGAELSERPMAAADSGLAFSGDLALLKQLSPTVARVHVVVTPRVASALPQLAAALQQASARVELSLDSIVWEAGASLPESLGHADALYLGIALPPTALSLRALLDAAAERGVAVVSGLSPDAVGEGALLSVVPDDAPKLRGRQAVLALQALWEGQPAARLRAELEQARPSSATALPLRLDLEVAHALGLDPSFELLQRADVVRRDDREQTSFEGAVARALEANRDLVAAEWQLAGGSAQLRRSRGPLMPQVVANASGVWIDEDRGAGPFPPAERQVSVGGTASQTLYSPRRIGTFAVEKQLQRARSQDFAAAQLDVTYDVAVRYVELMRARVIVDIAEQRVRSSRANLALAEGRHDAGDVGRDEIFRWRVDLAESQQALVRAKAALAQSVASLNEVQAYGPQRDVRPEERDGSALPMLATDARLAAYFERPRSLRALEDVAIERTLQEAPELEAARARVRAAERGEKQQLRTLFLPEVDFQASLTARVWRGGAGSGTPSVTGFVIPNNVDWSVGVVASLPLFEGLAQRASFDQASAEAERVRAEEQAVALQLSRQVFDALQDASAAHQATALASAAAEASRENLAIVRDAYTRGAVDVIRLVDAQTQAYASELTAKNAYHDYLIAFVAVERRLGQFSFGPSAMDVDAFFTTLQRSRPAVAQASEP